MQSLPISQDDPDAKQWWYWHSADDIETHSSFYTDDFATTGDGYIQDFSLGMTTEQFQQEINDLFSPTKPSYLDPTTGIIIVSFNCYDPSQDRFITTSMTLEFSVAGVILPAPLKIISYSLD